MQHSLLDSLLANDRFLCSRHRTGLVLNEAFYLFILDHNIYWHAMVRLMDKIPPPPTFRGFVALTLLLWQSSIAPFSSHMTIYKTQRKLLFLCLNNTLKYVVAVFIVGTFPNIPCLLFALFVDVLVEQRVAV
jgi:hypothetical protein